MQRLIVLAAALLGVATFGLAAQGAGPRSKPGPGKSGAEKPGGRELAAGDPAPRFALPGSDGNTYRLEDYLGKQAVVVAWFPKAFTGG